MAKVKNYLTKDERSYIATMFIAREAVEKMLGYGMSKEEAKNLKTCRAFYDRYSHDLFQRVGEGESVKLIREFSGGEVEIRRNVKARALHELTFDASDVHDLAGPIIESHCRGCHKTGVEAADCSINKIFIRALVPTEQDLIPTPDKEVHQWQDYGNTYTKVYDTYPNGCPFKPSIKLKGDKINE